MIRLGRQDQPEHDRSTGYVADAVKRQPRFSIFPIDRVRLDGPGNVLYDEFDAFPKTSNAHD